MSAKTTASLALPVLETARQPRPEDGRREEMNFGAVLRATQGRRDDLPPPPEFDAPPADLAERCRRALYEVADPEFPISVVDLGLIYGVEVDERGAERAGNGKVSATGRGPEGGAHVTVRLTFTATACPCMDFIEWDVRERLLGEPGVGRVTLETTWDPPWTTRRITERGRTILERAGVSI